MAIVPQVQLHNPSEFPNSRTFGDFQALPPWMPAQALGCKERDGDGFGIPVPPALLLVRVLPTNALERLTVGLHIQEPTSLAIPLDPADRRFDLRTVPDRALSVALARVLCHSSPPPLSAGQGDHPAKKPENVPCAYLDEEPTAGPTPIAHTAPDY